MATNHSKSPDSGDLIPLASPFQSLSTSPPKDLKPLILLRLASNEPRRINCHENFNVAFSLQNGVTCSSSNRLNSRIRQLHGRSLQSSRSRVLVGHRMHPASSAEVCKHFRNECQVPGDGLVNDLIAGKLGRSNWDFQFWLRRRLTWLHQFHQSGCA